MVQGIMELLFDAAYLIFAFVVGVYLIVKGNGKYFKLFGVMAVVLSSGDAFHLVPRVYSLLTTGLEANAFALGLGKLITSVTMTAFYVILYFILESVWRPEGKVRLANRIAVLRLPSRASHSAHLPRTTGSRERALSFGEYCATYRSQSSAYR